MVVNDQVEVRCSRFDPDKMETIEGWRLGRVTSFDDFSFELKFFGDNRSECEVFPISLFEQGDARLIPVSSFSSMFYE